MYIDPKTFDERTGSLEETASRIADDICGTFCESYLNRCQTSVTTFALFIKHLLRNYMKTARAHYTAADVVNICNTLAQLSGYGTNEYGVSDYNNPALIEWCYAFAKKFHNFTRNITHAIHNWQRTADATAFCEWNHMRQFRVVAEDIYRPYRGFFVEESLLTLEDGGTKKIYKTHAFATEQEARLFIAELVMKLNEPWIAELNKAANKIVSEIKDAREKLRHDATFQDEMHARLDQERLDNLIDEPRQHVYCFEASDGTTKIGISNNIKNRRASLQNTFKVKLLRMCCTCTFPSSVARKIEVACHRHFAEQHAYGEFFNVPFDTARDYLAEHAPIIREGEYR